MHTTRITPSRAQVLRGYLPASLLAVPVYPLITWGLARLNGKPFGPDQLWESLGMGIVITSVLMVMFWYDRQRKLQQAQIALRPGETIQEKALVWWHDGRLNKEGTLVLTSERLVFVPRYGQPPHETALRDVQVVQTKPHSWLYSWQKTHLKLAAQAITVQGWVPGQALTAHA